MSKYLKLGYFSMIPVIFGIVIVVMSASVVKADEEEVVLNVKGMTCGMCSNAVKTALLKCEGVNGAEVSHKEGKAVVKVEEGKAKTEELIHAVEKAGFKASKS
ncbi:MAG: heavy-metal-associated domain-containing protein [Candidatus Scalinduaceae bacterium]